MATNSTPLHARWSILTTKGQQWLGTMLTFFQRRPITSAVGILLADVIVVTLINLATKTWLPTIQPPDFLALCIVTVIIAVIVTLMGWWRRIGFNRPAHWREIHLLWLPALLALVVPFLNGSSSMGLSTTAYLVLAYALVGLREEALYRGIILRVLRPIGPARSVLITSVLFGSAHLANLLVRSNPVLVFAQVIGAFCFGVAMGALRLRTNTIWFL